MIYVFEFWCDLATFYVIFDGYGGAAQQDGGVQGKVIFVFFVF